MKRILRFPSLALTQAEVGDTDRVVRVVEAVPVAHVHRFLYMACVNRFKV